ncbi:MAG: cob(I)yrinic acid a,c-diamide adenosyltransferase [SAR324 cluster bacterium]|nr:cob(I)yrinic acid a,c-diamide adenosyltransferase [SAR324 cluster bacterium]
MVRINRVYTKKGDGGETSLVGGRAVSKDDPRVQCYGTVDELNSLIGIVRSFNAEKPAGQERDGFDRGLQAIQQRLFDLGAELATHPGDEYEGQVKISAKDVTWLERAIDRLNADLAPLENFVLPGGSPLNAFLHHARTVCRRAEREAVALSRHEKVGKHVIPYLNRLSDALFVFSRWSAVSLGEQETLWEPGLSPDDNWP